jgi:putative spermidine/putrescine transport system substrate-binding protein
MCPYFLVTLSPQMDRRKFLTVMGGASLVALAAGCQSVSVDSLRIAMLEGSIPPQLVQAFKRQLSEEEGVSVIPADSLLKLFELLQKWQQQTLDNEEVATTQPVANWLTLGDYWLQSAIQQELVQPVDVSRLSYWQDLPRAWGELLRRDPAGVPSATGDVWGVPYRWSNLAILYNPSKTAEDASTTQWEDLLRPAWTRRLVLPDHPRVVIGLGLKAVGASANVEDPAQVPGLEGFLKALHQQARFYSSDRYLETLIIGDADIVVGWAEEMQPVLEQYRQFAGVVPGPGTLLAADLWVQPKTAEPIAFADSWLNFCLSADFAELFASYGPGVSPRWLGQPPKALPDVLRQSPLLSPDTEVQADSEFLLPLSESAQTRYLELWQSVRG